VGPPDVVAISEAWNWKGDCGHLVAINKMAGDDDD